MSMLKEQAEKKVRLIRVCREQNMCSDYMCMRTQYISCTCVHDTIHTFVHVLMCLKYTDICHAHIYMSSVYIQMYLNVHSIVHCTLVE